MILVDTHVLVWLHHGARNRIPGRVQRRLNREQLGLSPFVELELGYLREARRIRYTAQQIVTELQAPLELVVADISAVAVCTAAAGLTWTRDPFDRLIAAHATAANLPLVTNDETVRRYLPLAWWAD